MQRFVHPHVHITQYFGRFHDWGVVAELCVVYEMHSNDEA